MRTHLSIVLSCLLVGCVSGRNVMPTSAEHPTANLQPTVKVTIASEVPRELDVSFHAVWMADVKIPGCSYYENAYLRFEGARFPYSLTLPLHAERRDGRLVVPVVLDQYLPGRCNWQLGIIRMLVADSKSEPQAMDIYYSTHRATSSSNADVWCRKAKRFGDAREQVFCSFSDVTTRGKIITPSSLALGRDVPTAHMRVHYLQ